VFLKCYRNTGFLSSRPQINARVFKRLFYKEQYGWQKSWALLKNRSKWTSYYRGQRKQFLHIRGNFVFWAMYRHVFHSGVTPPGGPALFGHFWPPPPPPPPPPPLCSTKNTKIGWIYGLCLQSFLLIKYKGEIFPLTNLFCSWVSIKVQRQVMPVFQQGLKFVCV
jgi:hypothetical protein